MVLHEGHNGQARRKLDVVVHPLPHLHRGRFHELSDADMPYGGARHMAPSEIFGLRRAEGLS